MPTDVLERAADLERRGEPFALATVVRVYRPVSARPGDRAVIGTDGRIEGWVGGSCSQPIVTREALKALAEGTPRLVRIRPPGSPPETSEPGVVSEITTCASEGGVDVFVEPHRPKPHLVIAGSSPAARTLARLSKIVGYRVTAAVDEPSESVPDADAVVGLGSVEATTLGPLDAVLVATMNRYDETALSAALESGAGYVGLIASPARSEQVRAGLRSHGVSDEALERVHTPAGFDLGPSSQEEIALAVLAEIVAKRHAAEKPEGERPCADDELSTSPTEAVDPVCGMTVAITPGALQLEVDGTIYYFCNPHCRDSFGANPAKFLATG